MPNGADCRIVTDREAFEAHLRAASELAGLVSIKSSHSSSVSSPNLHHSLPNLHQSLPKSL